MSLVDMGPPGLSPVGSESEWTGECHGSRTVLSERFGPPEWECEARVPWCVYSVLPLQSVCVESIDSRVLGHGHGFVLGHTARSTLT